MVNKTTLTSVDWIQAGFQALSVGGHQAIKAERIAKTLEVSKGSFYWHFKNVNSLKETMLQHWMQVATSDIIEIVRGCSADPREQIRFLIEIATSNRSEPYGGKMVEAAIRDWARYEEKAALTLKVVDTIRIDFLQVLFKENNVPTNKVQFYATALYAGLIGFEQLSSHKMADLQSDMHKLLDLLLDMKG